MSRIRRMTAVSAVAAIAGVGLVASGGPASAAVGITVTFGCTEGDETWTVPPGVTSISVDAYGAEGGKSTAGVWVEGSGPPTLLPADGGLGGHTTITSLAVVPGDELTITVGCRGGDGSVTASANPSASGGSAGFNGGAGGGDFSLNGPAVTGGQDLAVTGASGGGGGGTRVALGATEIWAGGGGGAGTAMVAAELADGGMSVDSVRTIGGTTGGAGGGEFGGDGQDGSTTQGGGGGGPVDPGTGGAANGAPGSGSAGGGGAVTSRGFLEFFAGEAGGAGGGGWRGGGGGGVVETGMSPTIEDYSSAPGGGGGGSGFGPAGTTYVPGIRDGDGEVAISYALPPDQPDVLVRRGATLPYVGGNVYSPTVQKVTSPVPGMSQTFQFKIENDGDAPQRFTVSGTPGVPNIKATYVVGGTKVTTAIVAGTYKTPTLAPGQSVTITLNVGVKASFPSGTKKNFSVRATGTGGSFDRATGGLSFT